MLKHTREYLPRDIWNIAFDLIEPSKGVREIFSNDHAFVSILVDSKIVAWGDQNKGGHIPQFTLSQMRQAGVDTIFANSSAFVALLNNGRIVAWECGAALSRPYHVSPMLFRSHTLYHTGTHRH